MERPFSAAYAKPAAPTRRQFEQRLCEMWLAEGMPQGRAALELWERVFVLVMAEEEQGYGKRNRAAAGWRAPRRDAFIRRAEEFPYQEIWDPKLSL